MNPDAFQWVFFQKMLFSSPVALSILFGKIILQIIRENKHFLPERALVKLREASSAPEDTAYIVPGCTAFCLVLFIV